MPLAYTDTPESDAIARVGYDPFTQELTIVFRDRSGYPEYRWGGVGKELATHFLFARSKGRFYHTNIRRNDLLKLRRKLGSFKLAAIGRRIAKAGTLRD